MTNTDKEDDEENEEELDDGEELYRDKTEGSMQSSSALFNFTEKLLSFENVSLADNKIASLMETTVHNDKPSGQTSTLFTVPIMVIPTTILPPPHFFNPLPQQTTPTPTPTTSKATTSFPTLLDFSSIFKFNDRVTKLETNLSQMKQVDQYAQAISSIPAIIDRFINNKLGEAIYKVIQSHNAECREQAQAKKHDYIDLVDSSLRNIIRLEVKTQLPQILPKAVSDFSTPVIRRNVTESLEAVVLARADYKRELYDALINSYNTDKDLFETYGEVFTLKRSRDEKDKDHDPSAGSDRGRKEESLARKPSHKNIQDEPSHIVNDSGVQKKEFNTGNNDELPNDEAAPKNDRFKKLERPLTPDPDWNKRQQVDFRPPQTWISVTVRAEKPPTSFDELMDTPVDLSAFVVN
nr:hypothetical protein [Tanacetum cinerariifolium]